MMGHLTFLGAADTIIHGAARGADSLADFIGHNLGCRVEPFPAQWEKYHRAAGPIRNTQMLVEGKPDRVLAFHRDIAHSKGTADMVKQALKAHLPVEVLP